MRHWPVQDAKARFSEMLEACASEGAQIVTKRGVETAVLVPLREWKRLTAHSGPSLKELLLSDEGRGDIAIPPRGNARRRSVPMI